LAEPRFDTRECVVCGLCLEVCPTYHLRRDEGSGPRGRLRLMDLLEAGDPDRGVWDRYLRECVGCLACQACCPSGVPYGALLDRAQVRLAANRRAGPVARRLEAWFLDGLLGRPARLRRLRPLLDLLAAMRLLELPLWLGLHRLPGLQWIEGLRWMPRRLPSGPAAPPPRPGAPHLFFPGCVSGLFHRAEERAALRLLDAHGGYDLVGGWACCGAVHQHLGRPEGARELARRNIAAFEAKPGFVVTQTAGCGAAMKEYGRWLADDPEWAERARRFSDRVRDLSEVLDPAVLAAAPGLERPRRVTYDDPCHAIHAQGIADGPRALLDAVAGLERVEMAHPERCCGAGGTYFLRQRPLSTAMIGEKLAELRATGAAELLTANTGCRLQWEKAVRDAGLPVAVRHPAELWAEALADGGGRTRGMRSIGGRAHGEQPAGGRTGGGRRAEGEPAGERSDGGASC